MTDEQFRREDPVDEEGRNATQRRMEEEGTVWKDIGPADLGDEPGERETQGGPSASSEVGPDR